MTIASQAYLEPPLVSIFISCFNHQNYVVNSIQSVINQKYENIELLIIDDGSSDSSQDRIQEISTICLSRFKRFEFFFQKNQGLSTNINQALAWSKGKYFATLASDDIYHPDKTCQLVDVLEEEEKIVAVFGGCNIIDADRKITNKIVPKESYYTFDSILKREHQIIAPSQLIRTQSIRDVGGYPEHLYIEDWYMWLALTKKNQKIKVISSKVVDYRMHATNSSKDILKMHKGRLDILEIFKESQFFELSKAKVLLGTAIELSWLDKKQSFYYCLSAIKSSTKIFTLVEFYRAILRLLIPRILMIALKNSIGRK